MISTTYNGQSVWLWPYLPDKYSVDVTFSQLTTQQVGLTMREARTPLHRLQQRKVSFTTLLNSTEAGQVDSALAAWANKRVLVPFFPAQRLQSVTDTASVTGCGRIWWNGSAIALATAEIRQNANPAALTAPLSLTVNANTLTAPVMLATFDSLPTFSSPLPDGSIRVTVNFIEVADASTQLVNRSVSLTAGATVNGVAVPRLDVPLEIDGRSFSMKARIKKTQIGFGLEKTETFYTHQPRKVHKLKSLIFGDEISYFISLFTASSASVTPWWLPTEYSASTYVYGRFSTDNIKVRWTKPFFSGEECAEVEFDFQTLPSEQVIPSLETFGSTIGPVNGSGKWWGYVIQNSAVTWRFNDASFGSISGPGGTFTPIKISHGTITEEVNLMISDTSLTLEDFSGNPFVSMVTDQASEPLYVTIYEGLLSAPSSAAVIYVGRAVAPRMVGPEMTVTIRGFTSFLDIKGPKRIMQPTCPACVYDSKCGLNPASFVITKQWLNFTAGNVSEFNGNGVTDHTLQGGFIERPMPDGSTQRYMIADNYTLGDGNLGVRIAGAVTPAPTGAESGWKLYPGCDGTITTCKNTFNNLVNFRGFPRIPASNPSMIAVKTGASTGKK